MKSVAIVYALDVVAKSLLVISGFFLIRMLNSNEYARYTVAMSVIAVATQAVSGSLNRIYIAGHREFIGDRPPGLFLGLHVWTVLMPLTVAWAIAGRDDSLHAWVLLSIAATCLLDFARTCFQQRLSFTRFSLVELARASLLILILAVPYFAGETLSAGHALAAQAVSMTLVFFGAFGRQFDWRDVSRAKSAVQLAAKIVRGDYVCLFAYFFLTAFLLQADVFMLTLLGRPIDVATFGAASRYVLVLTLGLNALNTVLFPVLQQARTQMEFTDAFRRHRQMLWGFIAIAALAAAMSPWVLPSIDGGAYPDSVATFQVLCVTNAVLFAFGPYVNVLVRFRDFRFLLVLVIMALFADALLNIPFVLRYGSVGAAGSLTIAHTVLSGSIFVRARRRLPDWLTSAAVSDQQQSHQARR
jgi:O-antigen/teichoic acid export membrane protein